MAIHHFQPTHYHTAIGSHEPVLRIGNGDTVITTTLNAMGKDASEVQVTPEGNPQTGPFYIADAEPGDTLVVRLDRIMPSRAIGYTGSVVAVNVVDPSYVGELPEREPLDQATQHATTEMLRWLKEDYGLNAKSASLLLGQCVEYDLGNIFDPAYTMVCRCVRRYFVSRDPEATERTPRPRLIGQQNKSSVAEEKLCWHLQGGTHEDPDVILLLEDIQKNFDQALDELAKATPGSSQVTQALGKALIYDKSLSVNKNLACATCHFDYSGFTGASSSRRNSTAKFRFPPVATSRCGLAPIS